MVRCLPLNETENSGSNPQEVAVLRMEALLDLLTSNIQLEKQGKGGRMRLPLKEGRGQREEVVVVNPQKRFALLLGLGLHGDNELLPYLGGKLAPYLGLID